MATLLPWCTLRIAHTYFAADVARPLALRPAPATSRRLAAAGGCGHPIPGGYALFSRASGAADGLACAAPLMFLLYCDDPWFVNYTDLDGAAPGQGVFYADNLDDGGRVEPLPDAPVLPLRPPRFSWTAPAGFAGGTVQVLDRRREVVWEGLAAPGPGPVAVALDGVADGALTLVAPGVPAHDFLLCAGAVQPWGVVALYQTPLNGCTWTLEARKTIRRYFVSSTRFSLKHWQVQGRGPDKATLAFSAQAPAHGAPYWIFTADGELPLQERPGDWTFTLAELGGGIPLPYARGDSLVQPGTPGFSDIYFYC